MASQIWSSDGRVDVPVVDEFQLCAKCEKPGGSHMTVVPTPVETNDERFDAWTAYLARWTLRYPCRLELRCDREPTDGGYYLRIAFAYPDERDSRDGVTVLPVSTGLWPPSLLPDVETPRWLRSNIIYHLVHELDEHLRLDDARVFDPHVNAIHYHEECIP